MSDDAWYAFLSTAARALGAGTSQAWSSSSWCAWTTYTALQESVQYWSAGLPPVEQLGQTGTKDGGVWRQPFPYKELAHLVIPRRFQWERLDGVKFEQGHREQDLERLSRELHALSINHRLTELVLEVKLY